jgi:hypothetical protein
MEELTHVKTELAALKQAPKASIPNGATSSSPHSHQRDEHLQTRVDALAAELARQQSLVASNTSSDINGKLLTEVEHLKAELAAVKGQPNPALSKVIPTICIHRLKLV